MNVQWEYRARLNQPCRHLAERWQPVVGDRYYDAHCGRCGQYLGCVDAIGPAAIVLGPGWRHDGGAWRPTRDHLQRRRYDETMLARKAYSPAEEEAAKRRLRDNLYGRPRVRKQFDPFTARQRSYDAVRRMQDWQEQHLGSRDLPVVVVCPDIGCGAANLVSLDSATRKE